MSKSQIYSDNDSRSIVEVHRSQLKSGCYTVDVNNHPHQIWFLTTLVSNHLFTPTRLPHPSHKTMQAVLPLPAASQLGQVWTMPKVPLGNPRMKKIMTVISLEVFDMAAHLSNELSLYWRQVDSKINIRSCLKECQQGRSELRDRVYYLRSERCPYSSCSRSCPAAPPCKRNEVLR